MDPGVETRTTVKIPKGSSVKDIANVLKDKNLIRSRFAFLIYVRSKGIDRSLQAGMFILEAEPQCDRNRRSAPERDCGRGHHYYP